jgi:hypothetical protein
VDAGVRHRRAAQAQHRQHHQDQKLGADQQAQRSPPELLSGRSIRFGTAADARASHRPTLVTAWTTPDQLVRALDLPTGTRLHNVHVRWSGGEKDLPYASR